MAGRFERDVELIRGRSGFYVGAIRRRSEANPCLILDRRGDDRQCRVDPGRILIGFEGGRPSPPETESRC